MATWWSSASTSDVSPFVQVRRHLTSCQSRSAFTVPSPGRTTHVGVLWPKRCSAPVRGPGRPSSGTRVEGADAGCLCATAGAGSARLRSIEAVRRRWVRCRAGSTVWLRSFTRVGETHCSLPPTGESWPAAPWPEPRTGHASPHRGSARATAAESFELTGGGTPGRWNTAGMRDCVALIADGARLHRETLLSWHVRRLRRVPGNRPTGDRSVSACACVRRRPCRRAYGRWPGPRRTELSR